MDNAYPLKTRQIALFFIAFMPITKLFMMPSVVSKVCNEDLWLSGIVNIVIDLTTLVVLLFCCKRAKTDFYGLLTDAFGKSVAKTVYAFYALYFILKCVIPIAEQKDYVEITLYETSPHVLTFLPFFALSIFICLKKLRALGRCADILFAITLLGTVVLVALSVPNVDFQAVLPIGANGVDKIFRGSYLATNWFGDCVYLLFFMGNFNCRKKDGVKVVLSYLVSALSVIAFLIFFYGIFTYISHRQIYALTEISKYSTVINNIGRFDYLGIFSLLFSGQFSLILPIFFACYCFKRVFNLKSTLIPAIVINGLVACYFLFFGEYFASTMQFILQNMGWVFLTFSNVIPLLTPLLLIRRKSYEKA